MRLNSVLLSNILFSGLLFIGNQAYATETSVLDLAGDKVRRDYVDSQFGQIHIRQVSPPDEDISHKPFMALHLSPNSSQVFSSFLPLIGKDRIAIAPDYPGYGMSDPIPGVQRISDYATAMIDVIENTGLETPVDLLGYHTGAAVALEMARQRPELIGKIALVAVPILTTEERAASAALPRIEFDTEGEFARKEFQRTQRWKGPGQNNESVFATFAEKMRPGVRERGASAILAYSEIDQVLAATEHPLIIIRVMDDLWTASKRAQKIRPDAKYHEIPDYGHGLFHAAPDMVNKVIREFLNQP